jgi:hypothetical protein
VQIGTKSEQGGRILNINYSDEKLNEAPCSKLQGTKRNLPSLKSYGKASCAEVASPSLSSSSLLAEADHPCSKLQSILAKANN